MDEPDSELSREELLRRYGSQSVAVPASERRSPFKFLDSYDLDDADIFFGRDTEIDELLGHFRSYGHVLIYGESGSGKSSLVQCGLRSQIPEADALFIPLRVHTTGLASVCRQIGDSASQQLGEAVESPPEAGLVEMLRAAQQAASRPIVLFFDQFEELFIFHDSAVRQDFAEELASIRTAKLQVKILIGVRQDYLGHLSELEDTVEGLFDNRFWLRRMSRENAAHAVVKACATCEVTIDEDLAQAILHRLDPGGEGVELPYLQVVMDRLYRRAVEANPAGPVITAEEVEQLGDITQILGTFLVEEVAKLPTPDTGRQILKAFVTREGTRRTLDRAAVGQEAAGFGAAIPQDVLDAHLNQLASVRILREIADTESYELRHDALAATVATWISEIEKELIEVRDNLVNRFNEYEARDQDSGALLDQGFLDYLAVYRERLKPLLNGALRQYLEDSERHVGQAIRVRRRVRQVVTGVVGSIILGCLVVAVWQWRDATLQTDEVRKKNSELEAATRGAEAELRRRHHEEGKTWIGAAEFMLEKRRFLSARIMAGRALGFEGFGRSSGDAKFAARYPILLDRDSDLWARAQRIVGGEFDFPMLWSRQGDADEGVAGHTKIVRRLALSPDGSVIATASFDHTVRLWDAAKGEPIGTPFLGHERSVWAIAFSPGGRLIASGDGDGKVILWDRETGKSRSIQASEEAIFALEFHPDGNQFATAGFDGKIRLWDVASGKQVGEPMEGHWGFIYNLCFDPTGELLATASRDQTVRLWDVRSGDEIDRQLGDEILQAVAFHPDGARLATAGEAGKIQFWTVERELGADPGLSKTSTLDDHGSTITGLSFSPDGLFLAASSTKDKLIRIWDVDNANLHATLEGHGRDVQDVAFGPDGAVLASCGGDFTVRLWNVERSTSTPIREHKPIAGVQYARGAALLVASIGDGNIRIYDRATGRQLDELQHASEVTSFSMSRDSSMLAVSCANQMVYFWNLETATQLGTPLHGDAGKVLCVEFSPSGRTLACGSGQQLILWDIATGKELWRRETTDNPRSLAFNALGNLLAAGADDGSIHVWNVAGAQPESIVVIEPTSGDSIGAIAFDPAGTRLASVGKTDDQHLVKLWSVADWSLQASFEHRRRVRCLVFAPDGGTLAAGDEGREIHLWDVARGAELTVFEGHVGHVLGLSIDAARNQLASSSSDGTVRVWLLDRAAWNTTAHLLTAMEPPLSRHSVVEDGARDPFHDWANLPMGETATKDAGHYLTLPADSNSERFWRFYQAKNWQAAQWQLDQLAKTGGDDQGMRWALAQRLATTALSLLNSDKPAIAMARRRLDQAAAAAADCPTVTAVRFVLLARAGETAGAAQALLDALSQSEKIAPTPAGARARFEISWILYQDCRDTGMIEETRILRNVISANVEGLPAGTTVSEKLEPE